MDDRKKRRDILEGYIRFHGATLITMAAESAQGRAYAPHSGFKVGAAILAYIPISTSTGQDPLHVFSGCNVENAAFDSSECAGAGALMAAITAGAGPKDIVACCVLGTKRPCAGCLQKLAEFSPTDDPIMIHSGCGEVGDMRTWHPLPKFLPNQFPDPKNAAAIARTPIMVPPGRARILTLRREEIINGLVRRHEHRQPGEDGTLPLVQLLAEARNAAHSAYKPYSKFPVGAAVLAMKENGDHAVYRGCNIENAVLGATVCAERVALCSALAASGTMPGEIVACAIVSPTDEPITMCGECRQFFSEFSSPEDPIMFHCGNRHGQGEWQRFTEILPWQFP